MIEGKKDHSGKYMVAVIILMIIGSSNLIELLF